MTALTPDIVIRIVSWFAWLATCIACIAFIDQALFDDIILIAILGAFGVPMVRGDYWPLSWAMPISASMTAVGLCAVVWVLGFMVAETGIWIGAEN